MLDVATVTIVSTAAAMGSLREIFMINALV